jgi:ubiquitin-activating enzyme E1
LFVRSLTLERAWHSNSTLAARRYRIKLSSQRISGPYYPTTINDITPLTARTASDDKLDSSTAQEHRSATIRPATATMWCFNSPASVLGLAALALLPSAIAKPYPQDAVKQVTQVEVREILNNATRLERRACGATEIACGWDGWKCCPGGTQCGVNENNEAICVAPSSGNSCTGARSVCGSTCCDSGYWCFDNVNGICRIIGGSSSPGLIAPSAPLRPTQSTLVVITATGSATTTVGFIAPIPTGANGTLVPSEEQGGGGLTGGQIAGIVIGVILGVILLLLLLLYCCAKTVFDGFAALLGIGKKRKHTHEETYIEEHHHHSGSAAAGGRRWYGQSGRPSRPPPPKKSGGFGGALGVGAGLAGLAIALGLKRKHDRKYDDKSTVISGSTGYYSEYTSTSEFPR